MKASRSLTLHFKLKKRVLEFFCNTHFQSLRLEARVGKLFRPLILETKVWKLMDKESKGNNMNFVKP